MSGLSAIDASLTMLADTLGPIGETVKTDTELTGLQLAQQLEPAAGWRIWDHNTIIEDAIYQAINTPGRTNLIITLPPQHGKTTTATIWNSVKYLTDQATRHKQIMLAAYNANLARSFGGKVRDVIKENAHRLGTDIRRDTDAKQEFANYAGGGMIAQGRDGTFTGKPADLLIIDDLIKNDKEANSATHRQHLWDLWTGTLYGRRSRDCTTIVVMTRWHPDDLIGRLLAQPGGEAWEHIRLPAIQADGTALCEDLHPLAEHEHTKTDIGSYKWTTQYQGEPYDKEGGSFDATQLTVADGPIEAVARVRQWDTSDSLKGDYGVGMLVAIDKYGIFRVEDIQRARYGAGMARAIRRTAAMDGTAVPVKIGQEPGSSGKMVIREIARSMKEYRVSGMKETSSKEVRAILPAAKVEAGLVEIVPAAWNEAFITELGEFPNGPYDDQVDTFCGAVNYLIGASRSNAPAATTITA